MLVGERIRRERERAGLNQRDLAARAHLSQPTLNRIEKGVRANVTLAELDCLAVALDVPVRLLTSGNPVRTRVRIAARTNEVVAEEREEALRHTLEVLELDARLDKLGPSAAQRRKPSGLLPVPDEQLSLQRQAKDLAQCVRKALRLGCAPIADVDELIEQLTGVDTAVLQLPRTAEGFTATDPERETTLIAVRACDIPERQRFSFAHELGHLLWDDGAQVHELSEARTPGEKRCDAFARHLLAPEDGIKAWLSAERLPENDSLDERTVARLARHFRVSFIVILIQLEAMALITTERKRELRGPTGAQLAQRYGWGPAYEQEQEAAEAVRAPRRILERAVEAYRQNLIGVRALAMLEGRKPEEVEERLREAGILPEPLTPRRANLSRLVARGLAKG
ncbi:XRE family transcriptional regulator [Streptomyces sp. AK02-01A]|uniref:helix-turn-helix domain-containing protein n=1 Tax=Streptomyces sp. AK02-01A TaxID=3028648 RepID=UPI0029B37B4D|nr:XRE family transcriptional regulator [Streptomyces sp. AK02-01A]MDX3849594.1 XRE family transcriptional regulator [Streptomyces sp. AK02-01A]MDX3849836.1 XRE family transcriptional regulator [Streptomyces sp. AK02-01A]